MIQFHLRRSRAFGSHEALDLPGDHLQRQPAARLLEYREIALCGPLPGHRAAVRISALAHLLPSGIVRQQSRDFSADGLGIAEWHQDAAPVREQFPRVPVGCRDDRFTQSKTVRQRAGRHLRFVEVGRDVHIAHRDEVDQRRLIDELVEKHDMVLNTDRSYACHQALAVSLALASNEVGMCRAENDIHGVGAAAQDRRHGVDHDFDSLVGRQQTERQDDRFAAKAEFILCRIGLSESCVGNSVRNDLDLFLRDAVHSA